jgi:hypothetical protein
VRMELHTDITVLLRPIVQSYVMKDHELNKFGTCHMSFGPMNITENRLKIKKFPQFHLYLGYFA